jgi:hypothetical protein
MAYIFDDKKSLGAYAVPEGSSSTLSSLIDTQIKASLSIGTFDHTKYIFPATKAPGAGYTLKDVSGTGILTWELATGDSGDLCQYEFKQITGLDTNYNISTSDCAIEIISDTYTTVTLPSAAGLGGKIFLISRGSNTKFTLLPQTGEFIDNHPDYIFLKKHVRLTVMSNNTSEWYII